MMAVATKMEEVAMLGGAPRRRRRGEFLIGDNVASF